MNEEAANNLRHALHALQELQFMKLDGDKNTELRHLKIEAEIITQRLTKLLAKRLAGNVIEAA
jgi:hypothetical protein